MGRSGLLRHPARMSIRQRGESSWEEPDVTELAYNDEEEWQEEEEWSEDEQPSVYQDEDEGADDPSQYAETYEDDSSQYQAIEDDNPALADAEDDGYSNDADDAADEDGWAEDSGIEDGGDEERGLVPYHGGQTGSFSRQSGAMIMYSDEMYGLAPGASIPIFIAGQRQTAKIGALGHSPFAPRAHRPRPFFFHTLVLAIAAISLVVSALTVGAISSGSQPWDFTGLAGSAAPPPPPVKFHWYTVHSGDTAEGIAKTFGVKVGGILELNSLVDGEQIYTGMNLKVPSDSSYGASFHALLNIPYAPAITPAPPYGSYVAPSGFNSFGVADYASDPYGGSFGQCTWWAAHKRPDENFYGIGDAWSWADGARQRGYTVTTTPVPNATIVFEPGVQGALGAGHVAHVEQILPGGWILISEMNFFWNDGGWGRVDYRYVTAGPGVYFIH